jgi:hypothetical protein
MGFIRRFLCHLVAIFVGIGPAAAQQVMYIGPPAPSGSHLMLTEPEKWTEARRHVAGFIWPDHGLGKMSDRELGERMAILRNLNLKAQLEVGVIKEWSASGKRTFELETAIWDKIIRLGGMISSIAMDEPLDKAMQYFHQSESYAVEETADFIAMVRQKYPDFNIGDIEPFPSVPVALHAKWLKDLNAKLNERHVRKLDFYRIDPDWVRFSLERNATWSDVKTIENAVHDAGTQFSLIYWASDYPILKSKRLADESTWYIDVMHEAYAYAAVGGKPDEFVVQSWISTPPHVLPEDADFTFSRSVRDLSRKFIDLPRSPSKSGK